MKLKKLHSLGDELWLVEVTESLVFVVRHRTKIAVLATGVNNVSAWMPDGLLWHDYYPNQ